MNLANTFTFIRIFISPIFLLIYLYPHQFGLTSLSLPIVLFILVGLSELTDACDGYIARKYNQVTELGKLFDPMADSIYRISLFLTYTLEPVKVPMGLIFIFLYRDSFISTLRTICALKGFALAARPSGKLKAVLQGIAALTVLIFMFLTALQILTPEELTRYSTYVVGTAAIYTLLSGFDYIYSNREHIRKMLGLALTP